MSLTTRIRPGTLSVVHPAYLIYGLLWVLAAAVVALRGQYVPLAAQGVVLLFVLGLSALTRRMIPHTPAAGADSRPARWREVAVLVIPALVMAVGGVLLSRGLLPPGTKGWMLLIFNPTVMVLIPGAALLALGVKLQDLGLGRGRRPWLAGLLWSAPFLIWLVVEIALTGRPGPMNLALRAFSSLLQNGFSEEFLWRGALQTRLERLLGNEWGLVLASLLFGVWHVGANLAGFPGDYLGAVANGVVSQSLMGLGFGILFRRTGNLIAPTLLHVASHLP